MEEEILSKLNNLSTIQLVKIYFIMFRKKNNLGKYQNLHFAHLLSLRKYKISTKWFDEKYKQNNYQL